MSVHKARLGPLARNDLRDILFYTGQRWGTAQRTAYRARIAEALHALVRNPERGIARNDLFPGEIIVSRILHMSQDETGAVIEPEP
jgi:plasmid stabilization system protein ParE